MHWSRAIPRTPEDAAADRAGHPRLPELEAARGRVAWLRRNLASRQGREVDPPPEPDWEALPEDASALNAIAWPLVNPDRRSFGGEARALAMARRAAQLAPQEAPILDTLAWALFANALDAEAEAASRQALAAAPQGEREQFQGYLEKLQEAIAQVSGQDGLRHLGEQIAEAEAQIQALQEQVSARRTWRFADTSEHWPHHVLAELVERLRTFGAAETGTIADVQGRLEFARTVEEQSITSPEARAAWARAMASISDPQACPLYGGLLIRPQLGLLPLGRNPRSGLWEFWHIQTGTRPEPDAEWPQSAVSRWIVTGETGLVLVLIPGGSFRMGAERPRLGVEVEETPQGLTVTGVSAATLAERMGLQEGDILRAIDGAAIEGSPALAEAARRFVTGTAVTVTVLRNGAEIDLTATVERGIDSPNVDPDANRYQSPVHDVTLDPFFLSKYEMTQGQWLRLVGENPSNHADGRTHPVEEVSWLDVDRVVRKLALVLPTESQWEYACRHHAILPFTPDGLNPG